MGNFCCKNENGIRFTDFSARQATNVSELYDKFEIPSTNIGKGAFGTVFIVTDKKDKNV